MSPLGTIRLTNDVIPEILHTKTEHTPPREANNMNLPLIYSPKQQSFKHFKTPKANIRAKQSPKSKTNKLKLSLVRKVYR